MADVLGGTYDTGSLSVTNGSASVHIEGALLTTQAVRGDVILCAGLLMFVDVVTDDENITVNPVWTGTTQVAADYVLLKTSWSRWDPAILQQKIRELLAYYKGVGYFYFVEGDEPDPGQGTDGQFALKVNEVPWLIWHMESGLWVFKGTPVGDSATGLIFESESATALAIGPSGATHPTLQVDSSAEGAVTGVIVTGAAPGNGAFISAISLAADEDFVISGKGAGSVVISNLRTSGATLGSWWSDVSPFTTYPVFRIRDRLAVDDGCLILSSSLPGVLPNTRLATDINSAGNGWPNPAGCSSLYVLSSNSNVAITGQTATRLSTTPGGLSGIAICGMALANHTTLALPAWGSYFEAARLTALGYAFGSEIEIGNTQSVVPINIYGAEPSGRTIGIHLYCGGALSQITHTYTNASAAMDIGPNNSSGAAFDKGIVYRAASIADQGGGVYNALELASAYRMNWYRNNSGVDQLQAYIVAQNTTVGAAVQSIVFGASNTMTLTAPVVNIVTGAALVLSGAIGTISAFGIGRTGSEGGFIIPAGSNQVFTGTAAGDMVVAAATNLWLVANNSTPGAAIPGIKITTAGTLTFSQYGAGVIQSNGSGVITSSTLGVALGGTGITTYAVGDLLYASGATTLSKLAGVAVGSILVSGGVTTAPAWAKIDTTYFATNVIDTDGTLAANSNLRIPTQAAIVTYLAARIASLDVMLYKGVIDCSANPNYPAADAGNTYRISVAGKIGGASGTVVQAGDMAICISDGTAAGTQAGVGASWDIIQTNIDGAVVGPASSTSGNIATFSGTSGTVIQDSGKVLPSGAIVGTSDTQTLTGKTLTSPVINGGSATDLSSVTSPIHAGGSLASSTLTLESTTGTGTSDSIIFKTASQITRQTIATGGQISFGPNAPNAAYNFDFNLNASNAAFSGLSGTNVRIVAADGSPSVIDLATFGSAGNTFRGIVAGNTLASPSVTLANKSFLNFAAIGWDGSAYRLQAAYQINSSQDWTGSARGTKHIWYVTADGTTALVGMTLENSANLTMGGKLQAIAGTTVKPSINVPAGVAPTSPTDGDFWYDGTNVKFRVGGTTKSFTLV